MTSIIKVDQIQNAAGATALTIDNSGRILQPAKPAFKAYNGANAWQSVAASGVYYNLAFNTKDHDIGGNYDTSTYTFTCPVNGVYMFGAQVMHDANSSAQISIAVNGTNIAFAENSVQGDMVQVATIHNMTSGDTVNAKIKLGNVNSDDWYANSSYSFFYGYFIG